MLLKCVIFITLVNVVLVNSVPLSVDSFSEHAIVPDILSSAPASVLKVTFPNGIKAELGNELAISQVTGIPNLEWEYGPDSYYTVVFCDADAPPRAKPEARAFLHWLVVNIPGDNVSSGDTLTNILNSHPEPETGLHRYIFLLYQQPSLIEFEEKPDDSFDRRAGFSPEVFANKYNFGTAIAGNFYQTQNLED